MAVWSKLRPVLGLLKQGGAPVPTRSISVSVARHRKFPLFRQDESVFKIKPTTWQWTKFKDLLHYYICVGAIPIAIGITLVNIFVGPAQLTPIPEDYVPKYWEYHRHPITRFIARYILDSPQQEYEKYLQHLHEEDERIKLRKLEWLIEERMAKNSDYQAYYYRPVTGKYIRSSRQLAEDNESWIGSN